MKIQITGFRNDYTQIASCDGEVLNILNNVTVEFVGSNLTGSLTFESNRIYGFDSPLDEIEEILMSALSEIRPKTRR